jgi:hypothetical protein
LDVINIHDSVFSNLLVSNRREFVITINGKWQRRSYRDKIVLYLYSQL